MELAECGTGQSSPVGYTTYNDDASVPRLRLASETRSPGSVMKDANHARKGDRIRAPLLACSRCIASDACLSGLRDDHELLAVVDFRSGEQLS